MKFLGKVIDAGNVYAHCDLMCGVYDPAQARIEAQSVYNAVKLYQTALNDEAFKQRTILIKEERAQIVKHHLWVLWTDYFKEEHAKKFKNLHDLFWQATKAAGDIKKSVELADAQKLIDLIDEIGYIFEQTKEGYNYSAVKKNLEIQTK
ncbi:MAG: superoxide dismutase, Ni [Candidatus Spechtbacteria bacterium RIFCSPLOWO2_12_FULL_38_22]|uniref:Superoxide dismutase, Ni n=1 Tax=Candidatus Spechtbacteria bacterium RIFCSPLOWO2_12_FULL_38_22 TaxID=1802165 RepID=A0A1G2HHU3_9BACT|nr:MAG: superoxide dismutase, Ni [Candidatus Spechtbacteria bacterium RIFCSPHIGHO2_01_FULL_38_11]OGZ59378.1 MAG: superoxide dismutase, Ni [Candidatus Spechtbacteria bacterium RIFCSPLOWO2_01_FULL_38_20]OGZ59890.1 MAG: superoxide dismutase, Ni [Candidatus Spechtbacteria bacterium RIFCSPHIGHO2_12_FULL_38_30]OGZ62062.1 MAG: superoxide dismutase, Ni [Candidatus Spechtbacteria bacterium RIFCSPLOWO2_12_FULL_38_22]